MELFIGEERIRQLLNSRHLPLSGKQQLMAVCEAGNVLERRKVRLDSTDSIVRSMAIISVATLLNMCGGPFLGYSQDAILQVGFIGSVGVLLLPISVYLRAWLRMKAAQRKDTGRRMFILGKWWKPEEISGDPRFHATIAVLNALAACEIDEPRAREQGDTIRLVITHIMRDGAWREIETLADHYSEFPIGQYQGDPERWDEIQRQFEFGTTVVPR